MGTVGLFSTVIGIKEPCSREPRVKANGANNGVSYAKSSSELLGFIVKCGLCIQVSTTSGYRFPESELLNLVILSPLSRQHCLKWLTSSSTA